MEKLNNPVCGCRDCEEKRAKLQRQLDHPFYKKVDDFRDEIKQETLLKASEKYTEPFNPASWTIEQLGKHAMAENYDQGNYIVGLMEAAEALETDLKIAKQEAEYWRLRAIANAENIEKISQTKGGNY